MARTEWPEERWKIYCAEDILSGRYTEWKMSGRYTEWKIYSEGDVSTSSEGRPSGRVDIP